MVLILAGNFLFLDVLINFYTIAGYLQTLLEIAIYFSLYSKSLEHNCILTAHIHLDIL